MKRFFLGILLCSAALLTAQSDNTIYVKQFPGGDVGTKVANAMASCNPNTSVPCILVVDASLATWPAGTLPTLCGHCYLQDWRSGSPTNGAMPRAGGTFSGPVNLEGPVYNVALFGAKCDGATDDSAAIQAAINAAETSGASIATVWVPPTTAGCNYGTTLQFSANGQQVVFFKGAGAKLFTLPATEPGSALRYTGSGDAILIENGNTSNPTYFVSVTDLYLGCTAPCTAMIHAYNLNGPARFERDVFDGFAGDQATANLAENGIVCIQCTLQISISDDYFQAIQNHGVELDAGSAIKFHHDQLFAIGYDTTGVKGVGLYASGVNGLTVDGQTYFELMPVGIEIANDQENYGQYNIRDTDFFIGNSGPPSMPTNTSHQRCVKIVSTTNGFPLYFQAEISHNQCHVGPGFLQGASAYGFESVTSSNTFFVSGLINFQDNQVDGMTTAAFSADSSKISVDFASNISRTLYQVGSSAPVYLPQVAGSGTYENRDRSIGTCTMAASTSCTATLAASFFQTPVCLATVQSSTVIAGSCTVSGTIVTVNAATSNSSPWNFQVIGNPD